ncbi:MAG: phenylalanine--tRNA ligase subunit alpha, partial [Lachnospiraceae bacterium]|nr:phenylalanine--tRNA ligase subunit alpha [Lachnospiraceae bacterium]
MKEKLEQIKAEALKQIEAAGGTGAQALELLNEIRVSYLGKKGELTALLKGLKNVASEERPKVGQMVNEVRGEIEEVLAGATEKIKAAALEERMKAEAIDVTLPAKKGYMG